jgi:hypothetical protein
VLGLVHPESGERLRFEAELPEDFAARLAALERREMVVKPVILGR